MKRGENFLGGTQMFIVYLHDGETYTFTTRHSLECWVNDPNRKEHYISIVEE